MFLCLFCFLMMCSQIILNIACIANAKVWEEGLMAAGLIAGVTAALECAMSASLIESFQTRLQSPPAISSGYLDGGGPRQQLAVSADATVVWLQEADRLLVDTVHCAARLFKIAPAEVLVAAARETTAVFQRILVAL
jgi:hypothetical protein